MPCDKAYQVHERQDAGASSERNIQARRLDPEILPQWATHSQLDLLVVVDSLRKAPDFVVFDGQTDVSIVGCTCEGLVNLGD